MASSDTTALNADSPSGIDFPVPTRKSKEISLEEAGRIIAKGRVLHAMNSAMALIRSAIRAGAKGLTIIPQVTSSLSVDLLDRKSVV